MCPFQSLDQPSRLFLSRKVHLKWWTATSYFANVPNALIAASTQQQKKRIGQRYFWRFQGLQNCAKMVIVKKLFFYPFSLYYSSQLSCSKLFSHIREAEILIVVPPTEEDSQQRKLDWLFLSLSLLFVCVAKRVLSCGRIFFIKNNILCQARRARSSFDVREKKSAKTNHFRIQQQMVCKNFGEWDSNDGK